MRKALAVMAVASVLALTVGGALVVEAQGPGGFGRGRGGPCHGGAWAGQTRPLGEGVLHDVVVESMAEVLGMDAAAFEAVHQSGQTFWQIALGQGVEAEDIPALMQQVRELALEKAVAQGLLTQEQADWMGQRGMGRWGGRGFGGFGVCPYATEDGTVFGGGRWRQPSTG